MFDSFLKLHEMSERGITDEFVANQNTYYST